MRRRDCRFRGTRSASCRARRRWCRRRSTTCCRSSKRVDGNWDVDLYTEATVEALVKSANRFDCIVVGHNAAHKSADVRAALARLTPNVGLLVLHQLDPEAFSFMVSAPVEAEELKPAARGARLVREADRRDEILLNWPDDVALAGDLVDPSLAYVAVTPHGREHLADSARDDRPGSAMSRCCCARCRTQGRRRRDQHRAARAAPPASPRAAAQPAHVVLGRPAGCGDHRDPRPARLGDRPSQAAPPGGQGGRRAGARRRPSSTSASWPLWGTRRRRCCPTVWDPTQQEELAVRRTRTTRCRGCAVATGSVVLGPGESLTVRHGESDAHWVARRWASWFQGVTTRDVARRVAARRSRAGVSSPPERCCECSRPLSPAAHVASATRPRLWPQPRRCSPSSSSAGSRASIPTALGLPPPNEFIRPVATSC